ncbi:hypothetical protein [Erysipelothrix anatis]|uniref:hypothetical protein n=1 Tax=Erysipelothrix anatis TaxID=2683713 RepID=UPI0013571ED3|nr:hypothetical protein [Erysipelothrix anatis]
MKKEIERKLDSSNLRIEREGLTISEAAQLAHEKGMFMATKEMLNFEAMIHPTDIKGVNCLMFTKRRNFRSKWNPTLNDLISKEWILLSNKEKKACIDCPGANHRPTSSFCTECGRKLIVEVSVF